MKVYIRIVGTLLLTLIDIEALVCIISEDLAKKLRLKIKANDRTKIVSLGGGVRLK